MCLGYGRASRLPEVRPTARVPRLPEVRPNSLPESRGFLKFARVPPPDPIPKPTLFFSLRLGSHPSRSVLRGSGGATPLYNVFNRSRFRTIARLPRPLHDVRGFLKLAQAFFETHLFPIFFFPFFILFIFSKLIDKKKFSKKNKK